ncbi:YDG domain-containing protein [Selenomonas sputigena]|uniref:YDG domain-containing protein n=1 Tax=Selenomonas sputigena TaxID=69823 RepID=A0ABV3X768_9FIRM
MRRIGKKDALACQVSLGILAGLLGVASTAHGAPIADGGGPNHDGVRAGGAAISQSGMTTNITSGNPNNVIGWKDFSVKNGESVVFDGGAKTNNYLNVVTGKVTSRIDGSITGGNNVYIANTNGVVFGETANVNVGNLYVTTRAVDVDAIGTAVAGGATLASQESSIINTTAAAAPNTAKAEVVSLVDGAGHSVAANKIVIEGQSVRILNSANITATDVQISASTDTKKFGNSPQNPPPGFVEAARSKGYIHIGSTAGGAAPAHYHGNLAVDGFKLVSTPQELEDMKNDLAGNYMLKNDIDLSATAHTPIGNGATPFTGKFDGMFHEVKNMTLGAGTAADHAGLFGNINGAVIMNVGIKNANLSSLNYGGAVVGKAENSHIFNVYNESTSMIGSTGSSAAKAGGVVGWLKNSTLDTVYNTSNIGKQAGGLVGDLDYSQIMDAYNTGAVQVNTGTNINESWGGYATGQGTTSILRNVYLKNNGAAAAGGNDLSMSVQESYQINGANNKNKLLKGTDEKDAFSATSYRTWDIAADGGENKTWRIFDGHSLPLLTAFMQGTVQAEYAYADFQQAGHAHSGDTASTYTVQAADKQTDGSYVTRAGKKSNDGKSISRVYNADYLKIAKKNGDGSYSAITNVNDADLKLYGADDRSLVHLSQDTAGGGRRNAGSNAAYDGVDGKGGREAMLYGGQHGYDIAGANVTIGKRKVIGSVNNMGKIEREYDGTADASAQFANAIKTGNVSLRTDGLVDGDGAAVNFANNNAVTFRQAWTAASAESPDVGYDKPVYVDGTLVRFTGGEENYEFDASAINALNLKGNITQRTITATLNPATGINKVYDGDVDVKGAAYIPTATNNVLTLTNTVGSDTAANLLDYTDIKGKYRTGDSNANPGTETKQAGAHGVAYSGIKLTGANKHNYKLVDGDGNILYREAVTGEPAAMAGDVVTSGTIWGTGTIAKRKIDPTKFSVTGGADKVYDGTDYTVVDGVTKKITGPAAGASTDTNIIAADANKISFSISAADKKAYYVRGDRTTRTKNVYDAANAADGAQYLSYTLKAHNETTEDILSNYEFDMGGGSVQALAEGSVHTVTGDGKITPRTVYVDLLKKTGIDKEYDKDVNVLAADKQFGTNFGYLATAANANKLVKEDGAADDGAQITATAAVYKKRGSHTEQDHEVYRTGNALTGAVENDGKDVEYKIGLTGDHAATNYILSYTPSGGGATQVTNGGANDTVTMTGTGKITPKKLTLAAPGDVTRSYDTTSNVYAKQLRAAGYETVTNGVLGGDVVKLALGADNAVVGKYYTDNTKATEAENANARPDGSFLPGQTHYTVNYTFTPTLDNGNYEVANTVADGRGKITQYKPTSANFNMDFDDVTKTFDGTTAVSQSAGLSALNITLENGQVVNFLATPNSYTMAGKEYADKHANTDRSGALLTGKQKIDVTYKVKLPGGGAGNYDLSGIGGGDYTLTGDMYSGYTVARKKAAGYIKPKEILATVSKPNVTKTYNRATDVLDEHGQASGGGAIINMPDLVLGNGSNMSEGAYDNVHAGTGKTVTYTLKVSSGYENDYYFVSTSGGASITTLTGQGTITPREIDVEFKPAVKNYDSTSDVKFTGTTPAWGYKLKALNGDADKANTEAFLAADNPTLNTAAGTTLKGHYVDAHGAHQSDAGDYTNLVQYSGIKAALSSGDYTIADSKKGSGTINKRQVNAGDFNLAFAGVTKVYDATKDVKKNGDAAQADGYIDEVSVDLGGTVGKKQFTPGNGYTLVKAEYADPNVTANQGTGNVTYTLKLASGLLKNYSFADLNNAAGQAAGYSYDSANNTVTRTLGVGTITKRPVYALTNGNVSKTYDAATTVLGADKSVLTGDGLLKLGNKRSDGTIVQDAGLVEINGTKYGTNVSTAKYADKNYGEGTKTVNYTLKIDPTYASNYEFFDARTGAAVNPDASNNYIISTNTNTIKKAALTVRQDPGSPVSKSYDGGVTVEDGDGRLLLDNGLTDENGQQDDVSLNPYPAGAIPPANAYTLTYNSPNVTNAATAKNNVTYKHLQLTGADAGNYYLTDASGAALASDVAAGYFTMTGDGAITPLRVTNQNLVFAFNSITKEYDRNANVGGTDNEATWRTYINDIYIKKADGSRLIDLNNDIDKVTKAEYQAGGGSRAKDAATGKKVLFNVKFKDEMLQNLEFDNSIYTPDAQGNHMLADKTYDRYTTGDITKKLLTATLDQPTNLRKVYDGTKDADKENLKIAGKLDGDSLEYGKTALYDDANASVNPGAAATNSRVITYTSTLSGTDAVNYAFDAAGANTKTLTATGDIEKRKVYARVNQDVRKKYDGTRDVKINGAVPATGDAYVTFGKSSNAAEAATTGMVTGYGTNDTTAAYLTSDAGTNKQVDYTLAIGGDDGNGHNFRDNYVIYDANRPTVEVTTLSTYTNIIDKAALMLNAAYADKQYDGTRTVKNLGTLLTLTGAPTGIGIQTGYAGTYLDENVNDKGVDYSNVRLSGTGASNYTLSYDGNDLTPDANGNYSFHGDGRITKRVIDGDANLKVGFTGAPISKVYDGTAKVNGDAARFVNSVYVEYTEGGTTKRVAMTQKVDSASYKDTVGRPGSGKNAAGEKDVTFKFTLDDKNFNLANLTGVTTETAADGTTTRHYTRDYDRDPSGKALGEIKKRNVLLTVNHVEKIYDGTNAVRDGHYDADGTEHANVFADVTKTLVLEKAARNDNGELLMEHGLVESDGAVLDVANVNAHYEDTNPGDAADANRSLTGRDASGYKKVAYTVRLKGDTTVTDPNENYTFVNSSGTDITELDAGTGKKDRVVGTGDIWRKKLTAVVTPGANKVYDQNANVTDATAQSHLYLVGQTNGENVQFDNTSFDTAHNNNAVRAYYGTKNENGSFTQNPHVNRDADGTVLDRDVQYRNLQPAFNDLKTRNNAAKNYFVQEQEVFGTGKITPLAVTANDVRRIWRGSSFSKTYDGTTEAMIGGKTMNAENKDDFKRKLDLILGLSTGEQITLDYTMYGEDKADAKELRPHYDDKNVKNSDGVTTDKDMIYTLKGLKSLKELVKNNQNVDYDYSALATAFGDGTQVHLKDPGSETPNNTAAMITPKKVEVAAPYISKTYDATVNIPAGAVAGWTQADLVADEETRTMMAKDKVTVEVDATGSKFLAADGVTENADASADPGETVNGKRVKYQINLQSTAVNPAVETGNYEFSTGGNTVVGKGDIMRRMVHVVADDTKEPVDKMFDGDDYVRNADGTLFKRKFKLEDAVSGDTGILAPDAGRVNLANDEAEGHFASPTGKYGSKDVERDASGNVINKDVVYKGFTLGGTASNNYIVAEAKDGYKDPKQAKITPREIDLSLKNPNVTKEYDGTTVVKDNAAGNFFTDNIDKTDHNPVYNTLTLPTLNQESAKYMDDENAGPNKRVEYKLNWTDGNYTFKGDHVTASSLPDANGVYKVSITTDTAAITKRKVDVTAAKARKTYDATTKVNDAWNKLTFNHYDGVGPALIDKDKKALEGALTGSYNDKDAGTGKNVTYTFKSDADVMKNYEFANSGTSTYGNTVTGEGTIDRRHLQVVSDSKLVTAGRGAANFTGRIKDGVNPGAARPDELDDEINRLNDGRFSYGPAGDVDYMVPGRYDIHGWYMNAGSRTLAAGNYGDNFILDEVPGTLAVAPMGDDGVDRRFRPDDIAYTRASYDDDEDMKYYREADASVEYSGKGINLAGVGNFTGMGFNPTIDADDIRGLA